MLNIEYSVNVLTDWRAELINFARGFANDFHVCFTILFFGNFPKKVSELQNNFLEFLIFVEFLQRPNYQT